MITNIKLCQMVQIKGNIEGVLRMQISRHWRLNSQRYRLEGVRYENGEVCLQARIIPRAETTQSETSVKPVQVRVPVTVGR